jgi:hypothetical protein
VNACSSPAESFPASSVSGLPPEFDVRRGEMFALWRHREGRLE